MGRNFVQVNENCSWTWVVSNLKPSEWKATALLFYLNEDPIFDCIVTGEVFFVRYRNVTWNCARKNQLDVLTATTLVCIFLTETLERNDTRINSEIFQRTKPTWILRLSERNKWAIQYRYKVWNINIKDMICCRSLQLQNEAFCCSQKFYIMLIFQKNGSLMQCIVQLPYLPPRHHKGLFTGERRTVAKKTYDSNTTTWNFWELRAAY